MSVCTSVSLSKVNGILQGHVFLKCRFILECSVSSLWVSRWVAMCTIIFLMSGSKAYRGVTQNCWHTYGVMYTRCNTVCALADGQPVPSAPAVWSFRRSRRTNPLAGLSWRKTGTMWRSNCSSVALQRYNNEHALLGTRSWLHVFGPNSKPERFSWLSYQDKPVFLCAPGSAWPLVFVHIAGILLTGPVVALHDCVHNALHVSN